MGMSAAHCQGNVREFQGVWRVVTLCGDFRQNLFVVFLVIFRERKTVVGTYVKPYSLTHCD